MGWELLLENVLRATESKVSI